MDINLTKKEFYKRIYNIKRFKFVKSVLKSNMQHKNTSTYKHARNVAYNSFVLAKKLEKRYNLKFNYDELVEAAYLHDFCLYDWHTKDKRHRLHGFRHPKIAAETAKNICGINKEEQRGSKNKSKDAKKLICVKTDVGSNYFGKRRHEHADGVADTPPFII